MTAQNNKSNMAFVQDLNPMSGSNCWRPVSEDYDYQQEVARAGFADMLHDKERVKRGEITQFTSIRPFCRISCTTKA